MGSMKRDGFLAAIAAYSLPSYDGYDDSARISPVYGSITTAETDFARSADHAPTISCSTASWRPASIVRRMSWPGAPGSWMTAVSGIVRDATSRWAWTIF